MDTRRRSFRAGPEGAGIGTILLMRLSPSTAKSPRRYAVDEEGADEEEEEEAPADAGSGWLGEIVQDIEHPLELIEDDMEIIEEELGIGAEAAPAASPEQPPRKAAAKAKAKPPKSPPPPPPPTPLSDPAVPGPEKTALQQRLERLETEVPALENDLAAKQSALRSALDDRKSAAKELEKWLLDNGYALHDDAEPGAAVEWEWTSEEVETALAGYEKAVTSQKEELERVEKQIAEVEQERAEKLAAEQKVRDEAEMEKAVAVLEAEQKEKEGGGEKSEVDKEVEVVLSGVMAAVTAQAAALEMAQDAVGAVSDAAQEEELEEGKEVERAVTAEEEKPEKTDEGKEVERADAEPEKTEEEKEVERAVTAVLHAVTESVGRRVAEVEAAGTAVDGTKPEEGKVLDDVLEAADKALSDALKRKAEEEAAAAKKAAAQDVAAAPTVGGEVVAATEAEDAAAAEGEAARRKADEETAALVGRQLAAMEQAEAQASVIAEAVVTSVQKSVLDRFPAVLAASSVQMVQASGGFSSSPDGPSPDGPSEARPEDPEPAILDDDPPDDPDALAAAESSVLHSHSSRRRPKHGSPEEGPPDDPDALAAAESSVLLHSHSSRRRHGDGSPENGTAGQKGAHRVDFEVHDSDEEAQRRLRSADEELNREQAEKISRVVVDGAIGRTVVRAQERILEDERDRATSKTAIDAAVRRVVARIMEGEHGRSPRGGAEGRTRALWLDDERLAEAVDAALRREQMEDEQSHDETSGKMDTENLVHGDGDEGAWGHRRPGVTRQPGDRDPSSTKRFFEGAHRAGCVGKKKKKESRQERKRTYVVRIMSMMLPLQQGNPELEWAGRGARRSCQRVGVRMRYNQRVGMRGRVRHSEFCFHGGRSGRTQHIEPPPIARARGRRPARKSTCETWRTSLFSASSTDPVRRNSRWRSAAAAAPRRPPPARPAAP